MFIIKTLVPHITRGVCKNDVTPYAEFFLNFYLFICLIFNWCFKEPAAHLLNNAYRRLSRVKC